MQPATVGPNPSPDRDPSTSAITGHCLCGAVTIAARSWPLRSEIYVDRAMACALLAGDHRRKSRAQYEAENPFIEGDIE